MSSADMKTGTPAFLFISLLISHIESRVVELGGGRLVRYITVVVKFGYDLTFSLFILFAIYMRCFANHLPCTDIHCTKR